MNSAFLLRVALVGLSACGSSLISAQPAVRPSAGQGEQGYDLQIASFGITRAYSVGTGMLTLIGTVRNSGQAALPAETVMLKMYALAGLDYMEGATTIRLPVMTPGSALTYRWKVQPISADTPLVAAMTIERPGAVPVIRVLPIQHFADTPSAFGPGTGGDPKKPPTAQAGSAGGWLDNGMIRARATRTNSEVVTLFVWVRTTGGWRQVGVAMPILDVLSAEGGQEPWWEVLKAKGFSASADKTKASLVISGQVGVRWKATVEIIARAGSAALDMHLTLAPNRRMKLSGLRYSRLHMGEGSFGAAASEALVAEPNGAALASAVRWGNVTGGVVWSARPPVAGWTQAVPQDTDGAEHRVLGVEYLTIGPPTILDKGASLKAHWRLFALSPSTSVRDALRITLPAR